RAGGVGLEGDGRGEDPDHRHRGRPGLRRAGAGLPRPVGAVPGLQAEVRQAVRRPRKRGEGRGGNLLPRGPRRHLPLRRAHLPVRARMQILAAKPKQQFACLAFDPSGRRLFTGDYAGGVEVWNLASGQSNPCVPPSRPPRMVRQIAVSPDGRSLIVAGGRNRLRIVRLDGPEVSDFPLWWADVSSAALSPDASRLIVCGLTATDGTGEAVASGFTLSWGEGSRPYVSPNWQEGRRRGFWSAATFLPEGQTFCLAECWQGGGSLQAAVSVRA